MTLPILIHQSLTSVLPLLIDVESCFTRHLYLVCVFFLLGYFFFESTSVMYIMVSFFVNRIHPSFSFNIHLASCKRTHRLKVRCVARKRGSHAQNLPCYTRKRLTCSNAPSQLRIQLSNRCFIIGSASNVDSSSEDLYRTTSSSHNTHSFKLLMFHPPWVCEGVLKNTIRIMISILLCVGLEIPLFCKSVCVCMRKMYLSHQLRDSLSYRRRDWILATNPGRNNTMVVVFCEDCDQVAIFFGENCYHGCSVFCEDCDHARSVFVRTAIMVVVLIRLKISEIF